jgi:hypothetical protein
MSILYNTTAPARAEGFLLSEGNGTISREVGILAASQTIAPGTLLGRRTTGGQLAAYSNAATDGTETAVGVALRAAVTAAGQTAEIAFIARDAEVLGSELVGLDVAGAADLAALGIIVR